MRSIPFLLFLLVSLCASAQREVLFTVDDQPMYTDDFVHIYTKNNVDGSADFSRSSLEEYLELYINFRLKVAQAEDLGMDTAKTFQQELKANRRQLAESYVYDKEVTEELVDEAVERMQTEVEVSHILIRWPNQPATATDTANALKTIKTVADRLSKGEDFGDLAVQFSQDKYVEKNRGKLGYITVFQTVYPFENAVYNTPVGGVSDPVATRFGYHLVKVHDRRPARGKVTVGHLVVDDKALADSLYRASQNGADWLALCKQFSKDKETAEKGGLKPTFGPGKMVPAFEDAAFSLSEPGEVSKPVQTDYGWHLIRLFKKQPVPSGEEAKRMVKQKIKRDRRSNMAEEKMLAAFKKDINFTTRSNVRDALYKSISLSEMGSGASFVDNNPMADDTLATFADTALLSRDFLSYISTRKSRELPDEWKFHYLQQQYNRYVDQTLITYKKKNLERFDIRFRRLMDEYRNGILIFNLSNEKVWQKASTDTLGLETFYKANRTAYTWPERARILRFEAKTKEDLQEVEKGLTKGKTPKQLLDKINKKDSLVWVADTLWFSQEQLPAENGLAFAHNHRSKIYKVDDNFTLDYVEEIEPSREKRLEETRGFVVSDYQDHLEKEWVKSLRSSYDVQVNRSVLENLIKE